VVRLIQVDEIEQLLLQLPRIVELQDEQPTAFIARATQWMDLLEQALVAAHAYQAGRIAVLRSSLVFARHTVARDAAESSAPLTRARRLVLEASTALDEASAIAMNILDEHRPRFADADRRLRDLLARGRTLGVMALVEPVTPTQAKLTHVRRAIAAQRELERQYIAVETIVGAEDALLLLGRALGAGVVGY
jgi:hypothetical protein